VLKTVNAGARLDRLPTSAFHRRILWLIGGGMFLDSFDIYLAGGVLGALTRSGLSNIQLNANFLTATFVGMLIGALTAGVLGDAKGRKFTYQFNLAIFGVASLAGAVAPSMNWLIVCRFFMGLGLGAEIVVGYGSLGEFIPPAVRGKWSAYLSLITNSALFFSTLLGYLIIPTIGWRPMFAVVGAGALIVWVVRKKMPESPRWLESKGRLQEAEQILAAIEAETLAGGQALPPVVVPPPVVPKTTTLLNLFAPPLLRRTFLGVCVQVCVNIVIYGFIVWVPTFLVRQGLGLASSLGYTTLMSLGGPAGALLGVLLADRLGFVLFTLTYLLVALGIATYVPELFPTENRLRGNGVAGAAGRIAGIFAPQVVVAMYALGGIQDVLSVIVGAMVVLVVALVVFGLETNQRSLEEIGQTQD